MKLTGLAKAVLSGAEVWNLIGLLSMVLKMSSYPTSAVTNAGINYVKVLLNICYIDYNRLLTSHDWQENYFYQQVAELCLFCQKT